MPKNNKYRYMLSGFRTLFLFVLLCFSSGIAGLNIRMSLFQKYVAGFWNGTRYCQANFFYSLLIFFSLASVFCIHHIDLKKAFFDKDQAVGKCRFIFKSGFFWIDIAVIAACCIIFPVASPFTDLANGFFPSDTAAAQKLMSIVIILPAMAVIEFGAYLSTVSWWNGQREKYKTEENYSSFPKFAIQLALTVIAWTFAGSAVALAVPAVATFFAILTAAKIPIVMLLVILFAVSVALILLRYLAAARQRRAFVGKLKRVCKNRGVDISLNGHPYRSIFRPDEGSHLLIKKGDFKMACRFVSAPSESTPLYLNENGMATFVKNRILFKHHISEKYFFDADGDVQKIIIVCPCRSDVYIKGEHGERLIESGDKAMEYRIYNSSGFINAMDRGLLGF